MRKLIVLLGLLLGVEVLIAQQHFVRLDWQPGDTTTLSTYNLYRGTVQGGPYSFLSSVPHSSNTYYDTPPSPGQYYYVATAVNAGLESGYSNEASAYWFQSTGVPAISNVTATYNSGGTCVDVAWLTDVSADSAVIWGFGNDAEFITPTQDTAGTTSHTVHICSATVGSQTYVIRPGQQHSFQVKSRGLTAGTPDPSKTSTSTIVASAPAPLTSSFDYWAMPYGGEHVIQGYTLPISYSTGVLTYPVGGTCQTGSCRLHTVVTGAPAGVTFSFPAANGSGSNWFDLYNPGNQEVDIIVSGSASVGSYTLTFTTSVGANPGGGSPTHVLTWNLNIDAPSTLASGTPTSYPAIPSLSTWATDATTYGATWCSNVGVPGCEQCASYYDGEKGYQEIAAYTNDTSWLTCAAHVEANYRDSYVIPNNGQVPGYNTFTAGLAQDFLSTGDTTSKNAINLLATNSAYAQVSLKGGVLGNYRYTREAAYLLKAYVNNYRVGNGTSTYMTQVLNSVLANVDQQCIHPITSASMEVQPFMLGLSMDALWDYYDYINQDTRIPVAVKSCIDYMKANMYVDTAGRYGAGTHSFFYNSVQYAAAVDSTNCGSVSCSNSDIRSLNLLIVKNWGRIFRYTGTQSYQVDGDDIWVQGLQGFCPSCNNGKQFSQTYMLSKGYVDARTAPVSPPSPPVTVTPSSVALPVSGTQTFTASETVVWSTTAGSINASTGAFVAPATAGNAVVSGTATSGNIGTANVSYSLISVVPATVSLNGGAVQQFTANFPGTWSASCGSINAATGSYTAPLVNTTCTVTLRASNGGATGVAVVTVSAVPPPVPTVVNVSPLTVTLYTGGVQAFTANVPVTWIATCGTINASGGYVAPSSPRSCIVTATAKDGSGAYGQASITVIARPTPAPNCP